jgi:hypothetical protein
MEATRFDSVYTPIITPAIKGMETVRLTIRELIFALMIVLNGPIIARTYDDRMKIARRLGCSDRTVRKVLFNLKRAGVIEMDARKVYKARYDTGYAKEMLNHVMDSGAYLGFDLLFYALGVGHLRYLLSKHPLRDEISISE